MRILLIYPNVNYGTPYAFDFHFGVASISALLKSSNHEVSGIVYGSKTDIKELFRKIEYFKPDIISFSITTPQFSIANEIMKKVKNNFSKPIIAAGGIHPTLCPEEVIKECPADVICIGEGEYPMLDLANLIEQGKDYTHIKNLWFRKGPTVTRNNLRPLIQNLNALPFPDRTIFNNENSIAKFMMVSRGCPYDCAYCCNHALREAYRGCGKYVRFRSVNNVIAEIKQLMMRYYITNVYFHDDILPLIPHWVSDFCKTYKEQISLPFDCHVRPNLAGKELFKMLKDAGCRRVYIGIEHGDGYIRKEIMNRNISQNEIIMAFRYAKDAGLETHAYNLIGLPEENIDTIRATIHLNRIINPTSTQTTIFYPFPGTRLYKYCSDKNLLPTKWGTNIFDDTIIKLRTVTREQIKYYQKMFSFHVYYKQDPVKAILQLPDDKVIKKFFVTAIRIVSFLRIKNLLKHVCASVLKI
jgi:radical SAM superfamily enzyme YgiQ (UPF0313 family)